MWPRNHRAHLARCVAGAQRCAGAVPVGPVRFYRLAFGGRARIAGRAGRWFSALAQFGFTLAHTVLLGRLLPLRVLVSHLKTG